MNKKLLILAIAAVLFCACKKEKREAKIDNIALDLNIERFDRDFWNLREDTLHLATQLDALNEKYPFWTDDYLCRVLQLGRTYNDSSVLFILPKFLNDTNVSALYVDAMKHYEDVTDIEKPLGEAFKRAKYFFPDIETPAVYMHISGLNQSICVGQGYLSISIDNYLGADYPIYQGHIYDYLLPNMRREMIVPDVLRAWMESEFPFYPQEGELLEDLIYEGKLVYLTSVLAPELPDTILMGYSAEQLFWCEQSEPAMWDKIREEGHLFSHESVWRAKYLHNAPFTSPFTQNSPGRGGVYLGWKIVECYMNRNKDITPLQLMENTNYRQILEQSEYNPK